MDEQLGPISGQQGEVRDFPRSIVIVLACLLLITSFAGTWIILDEAGYFKKPVDKTLGKVQLTLMPEPTPPKPVGLTGTLVLEVR